MIVDHIGIIVEKLDETIGLFSRLFGVSPSLVKEMKDVGIRIAYFEAENVSIELIEYISPGDCFGREVMGSSLGLNHLSFKVQDLEEALKRCENAGVRVQKGFPRTGGKGEIAFLEKESCEGILIEIFNAELNEGTGDGFVSKQKALERESRDTAKGGAQRAPAREVDKAGQV